MMIRGCRNLSFAMCLLALAAVCPARAVAQVPAAPVYACVVITGDALASLRTITAGETCQSDETRVLVVTRKNLLFNAEATRPAVEGRSFFLARIIPTPAAIAAPAPLFIAVTLDVNTDNGMYTMPEPRVSPALACVPLVDGLAAGLPQPLSLPSVAAPLMATVSEPASPGNFPYTLWSILREYPMASAGRHQVALACEAGASFHFRGLATLLVLQQASGD